MKQIVNFKSVLFGLMSLLCLYSCNEDEQYDMDGNKGVIYISDLKGFPGCVNTGSIYITPRIAQGSVEAKFPVRATMPVKENTGIHLDINNDLVESYNEKYKTSYKTLDPDLLVMANSDVNISVGNIESNDSVYIYMPEENFRLIEAGDYLIPIELKNSDGSMPITVVKERTAYYLTVNVTHHFNVLLSDPNKIDGDLLDDHTDWSITFTNSVVEGVLTDLFDGDINTYSNGSMKEGDYWTIDLGKVHPKILGIYLNYYDANYEWASIKVSTSVDNQEWLMQGCTPEKIDSDSHSSENVLKFEEPVEAQYIRLEAKGGLAWTTGNTWFLSELNLYEYVSQISNVELSKPDEMEGKLVDDRSKWNISYTGDFSYGPLTDLLDGDTESYSGGSVNEGDYWTIDLGEEYSGILGVYLHYYSGQYDWTSIKISTSTDNIKWIKQGRTSEKEYDDYSENGVAKFITPVNTRYIKLEVHGGMLMSRNTWFLTEMNIYK